MRKLQVIIPTTQIVGIPDSGKDIITTKILFCILTMPILIVQTLPIMQKSTIKMAN